MCFISSVLVSMSAILCVLAFEFRLVLFQPLVPAVLIHDVSTSERSPNDVSTSVHSSHYVFASGRNSGMQSYTSIL